MKPGVKKGLKITAWVFGSLLVLLFAATLLLSPIAKSYINSHGKELVGRELHVDDVSINVYTGHVALIGLTLYEDNGKDIFARFDTLDTKASLLKLLSHTVDIEHVTLAGLNVNVVKRGDDFNFQTMLDHFASDEPDNDTTSSDWVINLHNIRLRHAQIHYRDIDAAKQWHLPDINIMVPNLVLGGSQASQGGLDIAFTEGGHLNIDANYHEQHGTYDLAVDLEHFNIKNVEPILVDILNYKQLHGNLDAHLKAEGNVSEITKSRIGGMVAITNADLQDNEGQLAGWNRLDIAVNNVNLEDNVFDIQSLTLDGFTAHYDQWADHSNIDDLMKPSSAESDPSDLSDSSDSSAASSTPLSLTLHTLAITNGSLTYNDHTLPDLFSFPVTDLNIEANDITLAGSNNAKLRAILPGGGHLMVKWTGDIEHWKQHQDLFISIKGLDMTKLSPWLVYYTGQPIEDGIFSLTSHNTIKNSALNGKNKIDIFKAQVGSRRKDIEPQQKLPLKTALYILKDKDDKILFDVPVKGNIDNPEFSYMKIVWKTLGNLLVKVATSPVRALGNVFGFGDDNLEFLEIDSTQRGLTSEQYHILGDLATIAKSDSLVFLSLELQMPAPANDSVAFRYNMWNNIIQRYLVEQGVSEKQFSITTGDPITDGEKTGYVISSEMKLEEE